MTDQDSTQPIKRTKFADRLIGFDGPTVWQEFTPLAVAHNAVNLGQGFPDWNSPMFCKDALVKAVMENQNQYCRPAGEINLVKALAKHYSSSMNRVIDPLNEVATSVGVTEGLFAVMQAFIQPGDEVIFLEPCFDIYPAQVQMAGGKSVLVPLTSPASSSSLWSLDVNLLESAITDKTKIILLNSPHNPTGMMLHTDKLMEIAVMLQRYPNIIVVMDEVYEHIVFSGEGHVHLATMPDMWDRTLTLSSAGKTFSVTVR
jgi:kynurenine--oxoglutarate transaminase/cysteine-S-conjugate beta-lyase/glutamine--phenylpyruvate transaminase